MATLTWLSKGAVADEVMDPERTITFYLYPQLRRQALNGRFNFINRIRAAVEPLGFHVAFGGARQDRLRASADRPGYAIFYMDHPTHDRALTMRKVYHPPFWTLETTGKRWAWNTARAAFDADAIDAQAAQAFTTRWRETLFARAPQGRTDHILVPLQGRLLSHRSFQYCSPVKMLEAVLHHRRTDQVVATLHPRETYSAEELDALHHLENQNANLNVVAQGDLATLVGAKFIVTQNSSVAFDGFFFRKPAVLFGQIDFHHIGLNVAELGVRGAFDAVQTHAPDYERYIYWFWQEQSINAGRDDAEARVLSSLRRGGWPV